MFILCIIHVVKSQIMVGERKHISIIETDLGDIGLYHKNMFDQSISFFNHLQQKPLCGSLIHYGLMQYLLILYPDDVKIQGKK